MVALLEPKPSAAGELYRGANQLLRRSNMHRSDQWQDETKRIRRRAEQ
jgi:hypothetical protein